MSEICDDDEWTAYSTLFPMLGKATCGASEVWFPTLCCREEGQTTEVIFDEPLYVRRRPVFNVITFMRIRADNVLPGEAHSAAQITSVIDRDNLYSSI